MPTTPATVAPGKLIIGYTHRGVRHSSSFNFVTGGLPADGVAAAALAQDVAEQMQPLFPNTGIITDWRIVDETGGELYSGSFIPTLVGPITSDTPTDYRSATICFSGRGQPAVGGNRTGQTRVFVFCGNAADIDPEERRQDVSQETRWQSFAEYLRDSTVIWADYYGQKASIRGYLTVQFNAHTQKRIGA